MTDTNTPFAPPTSRKLVPGIVGKLDRRSRKRGLTVAVKIAIDALIFDRCTRAEACKRAGFTERALYLALEKPEVAAYYNKQLDVLRAGERPRNIHRLCEIRDYGLGQPAVNAIKALEMLGDEQTNKPNAPTPGVVLNIISQSAPTASPPLVDVTPQREREPEPSLPASTEPIFRVP